MIEVIDLEKTYLLGRVSVPALKGVSLTINDKEMVSIMGRSGSGKSTLLRQIGLLDTPTRGKVLIDAEIVSEQDSSIRQKKRLNTIGYVFQEFAIIPELTALENVYLPAMMLGEDKHYIERARELLKRVELDHRADHLPRELSGGEQQRVAIARALINKPQYILADEPTANLDTLSAGTVMRTLTQLNTQLGVTIVFVSHDPSEKKYAQRHIFLEDGKITEPYF